MHATRLTVCALLAHSWLFCWAQGQWFETPRSGRAVHYSIRGALDWPKKTFQGRMTLTWRNTGTAPTQELPLRLHMNALRPPVATKEPGAGASAGGGCRMVSVRSGGADLACAVGEDETIHWVRLPSAVVPGASIAIDVEWETVFPKMQFGCGWADGFLVASWWYPKVGSYRGDGWAAGSFDPHEKHEGDLGDFGNYDVELSLPNALQLANTGAVLVPLDKSGRPATDALGREVEAVQDTERRLNFVYRVHAEDVRDFSWMATPNGNWRLSRLDYGDTQVFIYSIPNNGSQIRRLKGAIVSALRYSEERLVPYPYPVLSVVDLPSGVLGGGVSAPMLAAISNIAFDPFNQRFVPEQAVIRQLGDQLFKWTMAADGPGGQRLQNDLSEWFTDRVMASDYPSIMRGRRFNMDAWFRPRQARFIFSALPFPLRPPVPHARPERDREASGLFTQLEALLGHDAMEGAVRSYLTEHSFRSSGTDDFRAAAEKTSKVDSGALWGSHAEGPSALDYRIRSVGVEPGGRGTVTLERVGGAVAPITLRVRMKDGREELREWDGKDKLVALHFDAPIAEAVLDPMGRHPTLKCGLHTTWTATPKRRGLFYWASMASGAICGLLQGMGLG